MINAVKKLITYGLLVTIYINSFSLVAQSLKPNGLKQVQHMTLQSGDLKAIFIDNNELPPDHKAGYNGIAQLFHEAQRSGIFVPSYAGFNLEHIFGGDSLIEFFEPRKHRMTLYQKSATEVCLYQSPTPLSGVESLTTFKLVEPHYIDVTFQCLWQSNEFFKHDYAGFFWASYIDQPSDKKIYFKGINEEHSNQKVDWVATYSEVHGIKSTHKGMNDSHDFYFAENFNARLANHFSTYRYAAPFYYGQFDTMALAYFFDASEIIRFSQSPTGGGSSSPAWDFQYLIPSPQSKKVYSFRARLVYKPFKGNEDIEREYQKWVKKKKN
jgi:hypothetical protein